MLDIPAHLFHLVQETLEPFFRSVTCWCVGLAILDLAVAYLYCKWRTGDLERPWAILLWCLLPLSLGVTVTAFVLMLFRGIEPWFWGEISARFRSR